MHRLNALAQNINRLDGLTATVALFAEHADAEQLAQAGDADGRLGRVVDNICDLLKVPTVFLKEDYAISRNRLDTIVGVPG